MTFMLICFLLVECVRGFCAFIGKKTPMIPARATKAKKPIRMVALEFIISIAPRTSQTLVSLIEFFGIPVPDLVLIANASARRRADPARSFDPQTVRSRIPSSETASY